MQPIHSAKIEVTCVRWLGNNFEEVESVFPGRVKRYSFQRKTVGPKIVPGKIPTRDELEGAHIIRSCDLSMEFSKNGHCWFGVKHGNWLYMDHNDYLHSLSNEEFKALTGIEDDREAVVLWENDE